MNFKNIPNFTKTMLRNHFKDYRKNNFKDDLAFSKRKIEDFPLTKKMWEIMFRLDGITFVVLC